MVLMDLASTGLNLWAVQTQLMGLKENQATYQLPTGTLDLLGVSLSIPSRVEGTNLAGAQSFTTILDGFSRVVRFGVKFDSVTQSTNFTLETTQDGGLNWSPEVTISRDDWETSKWFWVDLDPSLVADGFRLTSTGDPITVSDFYLCTGVRDIPLSPFNRDDYRNQVNKDQPSSTPTNYFFEKLIDPRITLWGVPSVDTCHLSVNLHRQVQDVGSMTGILAIPDRWLNTVIWTAAETAAFELPDVSDVRLGIIQQQAQKALHNVETDETDSAPIFVSPSLGGYNG